MEAVKVQHEPGCVLFCAKCAPVDHPYNLPKAAQMHGRAYVFTRQSPLSLRGGVMGTPPPMASDPIDPT